MSDVFESPFGFQRRRRKRRDDYSGFLVSCRTASAIAVSLCVLSLSIRLLSFKSDQAVRGLSSKSDANQQHMLHADKDDIDSAKIPVNQFSGDSLPADADARKQEQNQTAVPTVASDVQQSHAVGVYFMNLGRSPDRREYMEHMFKKYLAGDNFEIHRIEAVDFSNKTEIGELLQFDRSLDVDAEIEKFCAPVNNIAPTLSYFKAMGAAYRDGFELALIMEDDASFELEPVWPMTLQELAADLTAKDPDWEAIRVQYTIIDKPNAVRFMQKWKALYPNLPYQMKWDNFSDGKLYGVVGTLWSRKGLARFTRAFMNLKGRPIPPHLSSDPYSDITFSYRAPGVKSNKCVVDGYLNEIPLNHYLATPPYFTYRLAENSLGQRKGGTGGKFNDHMKTHLLSRAFAFQFVAEHLELQNSTPEKLPKLSVEVVKS